MTSDEIWMREPLIQCEEEFQVYDEISELVFEKLEQMEAECEKNGIPCIVNDGLRTQDEMFCTVKELFHLTKSLRGK